MRNWSMSGIQTKDDTYRTYVITCYQQLPFCYAYVCGDIDNCSIQTLI